MKYTNKTLKIDWHTKEAYEHVLHKLNQENIKYHTYASEKNNIDKRKLNGLPTPLQT
mgnify:CR=1 FL=1